MFVPSPISVSSIGPVPEPEMLPVNSGCREDQLLAFVGSVLVLYMNGAEPHSEASTQMFLGAKYSSVGATEPWFIGVCVAEAMSDQLVNELKPIEPYDPPVLTSDEY